MENRTETVARLIGELRAGNRDVFGELFALVYPRLKELAHSHRARWIGDDTMNTTAIVHEAYLKLADETRLDWESRAHFLAVAAMAMRHILIDYAKHRKAVKRGAGFTKVSLESFGLFDEVTMPLVEERAEIFIHLDESLERLARVHEREAQVVECRFFGGMTVPETAVVVGVSPATVKRDWSMAQAWLLREMQREDLPQDTLTEG